MTCENGDHLDPKWDGNGLITAVATDATSGAVLMVAHMNPAALAATLATGEAHYWSRSRAELWHKGATSGNVQRIVEMRIDCDQDAVWLRVEPLICPSVRAALFWEVSANLGISETARI